MKIESWFNLRVVSSTISFIAIAMRNFAIGCELVGFFPQGIISMDTGAIIAGALIMFFALILYYACDLLDQNNGDLE